MRALAFAAPLLLVPLATHGATLITFAVNVPYPAWGFLASLAAAVIVGRRPLEAAAGENVDAGIAPA